MVYFLVFINALIHIAFTGSRVAVTLYALELGATQFTIGALVAVFALCPALLSIGIGIFADKAGPRWPMLGGSAGLAVALVLPPLFPGLAALFVSGFLLGFSFQMFSITLQGILGGIGGTENRANNYSLLSVGISVANFLGPLIAGLSIDHIGNLPAFFVLAVFTLIPIWAMVFRAAGLPKGTKARNQKHARSNVLDLWRIPDLRRTFIAGGILGSAQDLFAFYMPIYGHEIGLSASAIGTIIGVVWLSTIVIRAAIPFLMKRFSEPEILAYAIFFTAFTFALFPFFENPYVLGVNAFFLGLGVGCAQPLSMSLAFILTPPDRVGEAAGLRKAINNTAHMLLPPVFGSVGSVFGYFTVFLSNSAMLVLAASLLVKSRKLPMPPLKSEEKGV